MTEQNEAQENLFNFFSLPCSPRERTPEILVRFQAVSASHPCILQKSLSLNSELTLLEVRQILHPLFSTCYQRGFIFLWKQKEIGRTRERVMTLFDILPKPPRGVPDSQPFLFPEVQYRKLPHKKNGKRETVTCAGLVFLYEDSGVNQWCKADLQDGLHGDYLYGFSFIPSSVTSSTSRIVDLDVGRINQFAAMGNLPELQMMFNKLPYDRDLSDIYDERLASPLHYGCANGHLDVCEFLVGRFGRSVIYKTDINLNTPLHCALRRGHMDIVLYLLQLLPDLRSCDILGQRCGHLLFSLDDRKTDVLLTMVDSCACIFDDKTILHLTCLSIQKKNLSVARKLCKLVKVFPPSFYRPPLHLAAELGDTEMVDLLVNRPTDAEDAGNESHQPLEHDLDGHLPLHYASQHGHSHIIPLLYKPEITDDDFGKAVKLAITWHKYDVMCTLFKLRPDFDIGKDQKRNLVFEAENNMAQFGKPIIQALNSEKNLLTRLVRQAAHENLLDELELLESLGVELSRQDCMGRTALHNAVEQGHADVVYFLLDHGADANVQDWQGSIALHYACKKGNTEIINILLSHPETDINAQDLCGRNALMVAAYSRQSDVVVYLLQNSNVDPWLKDKFNQNILHYLILLDKASVILELLQCIPMDASDINLNKISVHPDAEKRCTKKSKRGPIVYPKLSLWECNTCGKKWHYFAWHSKSTHLCKTRSTISKGIVRTVQYGTQEAGITEIEVISQPFQYSPCQSDILSLIEMNIISNKTHYLQQLFDIIAKDLPERDILYLCGLAVKYWSIETLVVLSGYLELSELVLSDLLRISILIESTTDEMNKKKLAMVKYLLQLGACPNYFHSVSAESKHISDADTLHTGSFSDCGGLPNKYDLDNTTNNNSQNEKLRLTNKEKQNVFLTPLELAVLQNNQDLVELLLFNDASIRLCFAVHLAVMGGNVQLVELLLKQWDQEKDAYVVGCDDVEAMHRACSLTSGIMQAFCVSDAACSQSLKLLLAFLPDLLKSGKLLTATMVETVRPHLLNNRNTQLQKFLYRSASADHLQVLPITKLLQRKHKYDSLDDLSNLIIFMIKEGIHLSTVRVTKSGEIHAACELFVEATEKSLWGVIEQLLEVSGDTMWNCLLVEGSSCRRHVYKCLLDDDHGLCASAVKQFLTKAPLSCLRVFYAQAKSCVSTDSSGTSSMDDIIQQSLTAVIERPDGLLACCKILLLFPQLLSKVLSIMNPQRKRIWFQRKLSEVKSETMRFYKSTNKIIKYVHNRLPDVILMKTLMSRPRNGIKNIPDKQFTVAHLGCMLGNLNIVRMCFNGIIPSSVEIQDGDKPSLLETATAFGHRHIISYLLDEGAMTRVQTLVAACVGPEYIGKETWRYGITNSELSVEEEKLNIIQLLHKRSNVSKAYGRNTYVSLLEAAISRFYWSIVGWCLEYLGESDISFQNHRDALMSVFSKGPEQICLKLLDILSDSWWSDLSAEEAYGFIYTITIRNDDVSAHLLNSITQSCSFALLNVLSIQDKHKRNLLHFFCAQGRQDIIKKVLSQLTNCDFSRVHTILNSPDSSKATPLWYALAWHRWDICEILILNGAVLHKTRSFPLLYTRKMFRVEKKISKTASTGSKGGVYLAQCQRNKSFDGACVLGSSGPFFDQLYRRTNTNVHTTYTDKATIISNDKTDNEIISLNNTGSFHNLQYLLKLMLQALYKNVSIFHIAAGTGDAALISSILKQPLSRYCTQKSKISPLAFALVNYRDDIFRECRGFGICNYFKNIVIYHALASINLTTVVKMIEKTAKRYQWNPSTITPLRLQLEELVSIEKAARSLSLFPTCDHPQTISVKLLLNLIQENTSTHNDFLSNSFLLAAVISGQPWCFEVINSVCKSKANYASIIFRPLVAGLHMIDLMFLFAPTDKTSVHGKKDIDARIQYLERLADYHLDIALHQKTLQIIKDKRIFNMVVPMLKEGALTREQKDDELWFALVTEAAGLGYTEYVILMCNEYITESNFTPVFHRLICISALRKYQVMFSKLLEFGVRLDFLQPVEHICKQTGDKSLSIFECTVISGVVSMVTDIINRLQTNSMVDMLSLRTCLEFAYARGNHRVCELLEKFAMSVSRNIMSIDFCHKLFSIAVRRGNGEVCISLLHSLNLNVMNAPVSGMNNLDYACMYGMKTVVDEMLQDVQTSVVNSVNEDKMNALDYSRAFGQIELSTDLVETYRARSFQDSRTLVHYGWLSHCLRQNQNCPQRNNPKQIYIKRKRRPLTLVTLIRFGDDSGAVSFIKAAPETVISSLEQNYKTYPLLHLCSRYNCPETLKLLFESFQKYSVNDLESWSLLEYNGRIALAVAVECNHVNVVKTLNTADALAWRFRNGETVLHWVARYGSLEMAEVLTDNISPYVLTVKDRCGLTPAATAVACGNQHVLHLLLPKDNFEGSGHGDHRATVFDCVECLLDFCIGWFKHAQTGRQIHPQILNRNMRHRVKTVVGFRAHKRGAKMFYTHPLEKLLIWAQRSKSDILIQTALHSMGYPSHTVLAKMFLLRSKLGDDASVMSIALRKNITDVAIHILKNGYPCNTNQLSEMIVNSAGQHMNKFVNTLLELQYPVLTAQDAVGCSVLDAAYAMGNHTAIELFESKMKPDERASHLSILPQIMDHVSTLIRCRIKPGVHLLNEFIPRTVGLSIFDMYRILPQNILTEFVDNLNMRNNGLMLVPVKLFNRDVFIDSGSIRESAAKLETTKQNVMSIILSKLVLGRYPKRKYKSWGKFDQVVIECLPKDSPEDASLAVVDGILRDRIKVQWNEATHKSTVETADVVSGVTDDSRHRKIINDIMIPKLNEQIKMHLPNLRLEVKMDWSSIDNIPNIEERESVVKALVTESSTNPLSKLTETAATCGQLLQDISLMLNRASTQSVISIFKSVSSITVQYASGEDIENFNLDPADIIFWKFDFNKSGSRFLLLTILEVCHSACVGVLDGFLKLTRSPRRVKRKKSRISKAKNKKNKMKLNIDWKSFSKTQNAADFLTLFRQCVRLQVSRMGATYDALTYLDFEIDELFITTAPAPDRAGLEYNHNILTVMIYIYKPNEGTWMTTEIDFKSKLAELQADQLISEWSTKIGLQGRRRQFFKAVESLHTSTGVDVSVNYPEQELLSFISTQKYMEMATPFKQVHYELRHLTSVIRDNFGKELTAYLECSNCFWNLGKCDAKAGKWCWITPGEIDSVPSSTQLLVLLRTKGNKIVPKTVTMDTLTKVIKVKSVLFWIHMDSCPSNLDGNWKERFQIVIVNGQVFFVSDAEKALNIFDRLPKAFGYPFSQEDSDLVITTYNALSDPIFIKDKYANQSHQLNNTLYYRWWLSMAQQGHKLTLEGTDIESLNELDVLGIRDILSDRGSYIKKNISSHGSVIVRIDSGTSGDDASVGHDIQTTPEGDVCINVFKLKENEIVADTEVSTEGPPGLLADYDDCDVPIQNNETNDDERLKLRNKRKPRRKNVPVVSRIEQKLSKNENVLERVTSKLLDVAGMGSTGVIHRLLDVGANINAVDSNGCTPLILAAKSSHYVVEKLLLSRGADVNIVDECRCSALHYEAAKGNFDSVLLLVTYGAKVDAKDKLGWTPLRYAINNSRLTTADMLVFCGADGNIVDKKKESPIHVCDDPATLRLMKEGAKTIYGLKHGWVTTAFAILEAGNTQNLSKISLTVSIPSSLGTGAIYFICRRVQPEYCRPSLKPTDKEWFLSDVFEYRWTGIHFKDYITVSIPAYSKADVFDDVYLKTDTGICEECSVEFKQDGDELLCSFKIRLVDMNAFVLVAKPKTDRFLLTPEGKKFTSAIDHLVQVGVGPGAVHQNGYLYLEVIPKPEVNEKELGNVLSFSHFYQLSHAENHHLTSDLKVTLPLPIDYFGNGDLYVLTSTFKELGSEEEITCRITQSNPITTGGLVTFMLPVPQFTCCNLLEWCNKPDDMSLDREQSVIDTNIKLLQKARRRGYSAVFMTLVKPATADHGAETVVECARNNNAYSRLRHWESQGFKTQVPTFTKEVCVYPEQEFELDIDGNVSKVGQTEPRLQFHPYRKNFHKMRVSTNDPKKEQQGWVDVRTQRLKSLRKKKGPPPGAPLAKMMIDLLINKPNQEEVKAKWNTFRQAEISKASSSGTGHPAISRSSSPETGRPAISKAGSSGTSRPVRTDYSEDKLHTPFKGFLTDSLMTKLSRKIHSDWKKMGLYLGLTTKAIKKIKDDAGPRFTSPDCSFKMFTVWRKTRKHQNDEGLQELLVAVKLLGKPGLIDVIMNSIKSWLEETEDRQNKFHSWLMIFNYASDSTTPSQK